MIAERTIARPRLLLPCVRASLGRVRAGAHANPNPNPNPNPNQVRTLPTDEDESRALNSWWLSTNIDPADASPEVDGGEPPLHCNASLLVDHAL